MYYTMDSWCVSMQSSPQFSRARSGFVNYGDEGFWGRRITGGVNTNLSDLFTKRAKIGRRVGMIKPGAAFSVLTSENGKETLVSILSYLRSFSSYSVSEFLYFVVLMLDWACLFYVILFLNLIVFNLNIRLRKTCKFPKLREKVLARIMWPLLY